MTDKSEGEKPTIEELNAGNEFRDSVMHKADGQLIGDKLDYGSIDSVPFHKNQGIVYPFWHGWVIMDAFLAGIKYQKRRAK